MKKSIVFIVVMKLSCLCLAQTANETTIPFRIDNRTYQNGFVTEIRPEQLKKIRGDIYYNVDWSFGDLVLTNKVELKGKNLRYNLLDDNLEIKNGEKIIIIDGSKVVYFSLNQSDGTMSEFNRATEFSLEGGKVAGFVRYITRGDWSLVAQDYIEEVNSAYISSLDAGRNELNFVKKIRFFFLLNEELIKVPKEKKEFVSDIRNYCVNVEQFLRVQKINLAREADLMKLVTFLNSQTKNSQYIE